MAMQLTLESAAEMGLQTQWPISPFISRSFYEAEQRAVFGKSWLFAGSVQEVVGKGDYICRDYEVLSINALIVRGSDGELKAFHNVCPHRGNRLAMESSGNAKAFVCGMHSFTFTTNGKLRGIPSHLKFGCIDKAELGLKPLGIGIWNGFIFIHPSAEPDQTLEEFLGELLQRPGNHPISGWERMGRYGATIESNWKTFQAAFIENAHVVSVHPKSLADFVAEPIRADFHRLGRHGLMTFYMNIHHEPHPVEMAAIRSAGAGFMTGSGEPEVAAINLSGADNFAFDAFHIYPNFMMILSGSWATTQVFWPIDENRCTWEVGYYSEKAERPSRHLAHYYFAAKVRDTVREDLLTVEATQRSFRSGAIDKITLCEEEMLIAAHFASIRDAMQEAEAA